MAFFPHAFQKMLVGTAGISTKTSQTTLALVPGEVGVINAKDNKIMNIAAAAPLYADSPLVYLAQGSFHPSDKKGKFHGGYQETVKSKGINPKYVSRFYVTQPTAAVQQKVMVGANNVVTFAENTTYRLRIDVKGSKVLRTLTHNAYDLVDAFTACPTGAGVDPAMVFEQFAQRINEDPILSIFILGTPHYATLDGANVVTQHGATKPANWGTFANNKRFCRLELTVAYADTKFGDCSWTCHDHLDLEPIQIYASVWDFDGNPCALNLFPVEETQEAKQGSGYGEPLLKELILSNRYLQDAFQENARMREVLGDTTLTQLDRNAKYFVYHLLHSIPVSANGNGEMNADQYLIKIVVPARTANFETFLTKLMASAGNPVALEVQ